MEEIRDVLEINISDLKDALTSSEYDEFGEYVDNYQDRGGRMPSYLIFENTPVAKWKGRGLLEIGH